MKKATATMHLFFTWDCPHCENQISENFDSTEDLHIAAVTGSWGIDKLDSEDDMYERRCEHCGKYFLIEGVDW